MKVHVEVITGEELRGLVTGALAVFSGARQC